MQVEPAFDNHLHFEGLTNHSKVYIQSRLVDE